MAVPWTTTRGPKPGRDRRGITISELLFVMVVMGILAGVAFNNFTDQRHGLSVRSAENGFLSLQAQARAIAVEWGTVVRLVVSPEEDRVSLVTNGSVGADTVRTSDFEARFDTTLEGDWDELVLCMTPRGIADIQCNSFSRPQEVRFARGGRTGSVLVQPLGRAERN